MPAVKSAMAALVSPVFACSRPRLTSVPACAFSDRIGLVEAALHAAMPLLNWRWDKGASAFPAVMEQSWANCSGLPRWSPRRHKRGKRAQSDGGSGREIQFSCLNFLKIGPSFKTRDPSGKRI